MKVVILAGGLGTRLAEETEFRPKPMVQIGGKPIIWHIMKIYSHYGFNDFVLCLGYKGYLLKEYFLNYNAHTSDITVSLRDGRFVTHNSTAEPWNVMLVDTGDTSNTGGRIKRLAHVLGDEDFCMTYGDGLGSVDIPALIATHRKHGRLATVTAVQPPGRFGALQFGEGNNISGFREKPIGDGGWVNGGFFVLKSKVLDYIEGDGTIFERQPLHQLAAEGELFAHYHSGFWQPMDTIRDKQMLEALWASGDPPWRTWK